MNNEEALTLLNTMLDDCRKLGYEGLVARIGDEVFTEEVGPSGTQYQIEIQFQWDNKPGGDVRVMGAIDDGGLRAFLPLSSDLIMTPHGEAK
jgi:hypothetical protein